MSESQLGVQGSPCLTLLQLSVALGCLKYQPASLAALGAGRGLT